MSKKRALEAGAGAQRVQAEVCAFERNRMKEERLWGDPDQRDGG